jgi:hypothetical protein
MIRTLIIDGSCIAYFLEGCLERFDMLGNQDARKALVLYIQERLFLNSAWPMVPVWCLDSKPYWRSRFEPEYKGTRTRSKLNIRPTLELLEELGCHTIAIPEFEADDIAAGIVRTFPKAGPEGVHHYLLTTDNDWAGMVGENVTMLSPLFEPRIRQPVHVWGWLRGKYAKLPKCNQIYWQMPDVVGFDCQQVWRFKSQFGDAGDNLPPRCHPGLIDLFNPIVEIMEDDQFGEAVWGFADSMESHACQYDERRAQLFARSLPDLPFNPIRLGVEF